MINIVLKRTSSQFVIYIYVALEKKRPHLNKKNLKQDEKKYKMQF